MGHGAQHQFVSVYDWACERIAATAERLDGTGEFPHVTDDGRWRT